MWALNESVESYLLAFDIVSFSRNINNPDGLFTDREALTRVIEATTIFPKMVDEAGVSVQFLGDEFRLAFRAANVNGFQVLSFAEQVFHGLDELRDDGPTIRGVFLSGTVIRKEFFGHIYLDGKLVYQAAKLLEHSAEGSIISPERNNAWKYTDNGYQQKYSDRNLINIQQTITTDNSNSHLRLPRFDGQRNG